MAMDAQLATEAQNMLWELFVMQPNPPLAD